MPKHLGRLLFGTLLLAALAGCDFDILIDELDRVAIVVEDDCWDCYETVYVEDTVYVEETVYEPVYVEEYYYDDWDVDYGYDEYYVDDWAAKPSYEEESYVAEEYYEPDYAAEEYYYGDEYDGDYTYDDWDAVYY